MIRVLGWNNPSHKNDVRKKRWLTVIADAGHLTAGEVIARVLPYIQNKKIGTITLSVDIADVYRQSGYWRVPVRPSNEPKPLFPYFETLTEIEDAVQENEGLRTAIPAINPLHEE